MDTGELAVMFYAFMILYFAYERFNAGDMKNIIKWLIYSYFLVGSSRAIEIASNYIAFKYAIVSYLLFLLGFISFGYASFLIYRFSRIYGFAEAKRRVIEFFEVKKVRKK